MQPQPLWRTPTAAVRPGPHYSQDWHRDGQALGGPVAGQLPSHCVNVFVPLIDITEDVGPTEFWP